MDRDDIMTSEAVRLEANAASFPARMLAAAIDVLATGLALSLILIPVALSIDAELDDAARLALGVALAFTFTILIPAVVETLTRGRSLGKVILGYRIVRDDGGPSGGREAFVRALVGLFELWGTLGGLALLSTFFSQRGKRLGDLLSGTYAVRTRAPRFRFVWIDMPPELASWARLADITRLDDSTALRARMLLGRPHHYSPQVAERLALELAREIAPHVAPAPPEGTHPARFIAAVLAERRSRETVSSADRARRAHTLLSRTTHLGYSLPDPPS
ncbi:MAG: RDD family protein [Micrococcales bacterium]|nr:RDD family protein [Micrococcales bacterium]